jgi:hypothetical protein
MMSLLTGMPGDGKSLLAVELLIKDLIGRLAYVVTNLPLKWPELRAYVMERRKEVADEFTDLDDDLHVIPDSEVAEFYRFRSGGLVLPHSPDWEVGVDGTKRLERPVFAQKMKEAFQLIAEKEEYKRPVHYYIDECHEFFSSRDWATNGRGTLYYATKHRHLRDDVYLITQHVDQLEKQLRNLVSETHRTRNNIRRNVGLFSIRPLDDLTEGH